MFLRRVADHFHRAGWRVEESPDLETAPGAPRPDLLLQKGPVRKAVLVRPEEPPGPFELARFGGECRRLHLSGIVVAPDDRTCAERAEEAGLEYLPGESIGEIVVVGRAPEPAPRPVAPPVPSPARTRPTPVVAPAPPPVVRRVAWWRWAIVALIWAAALAAVAYDLRLYLGR